MSPTQSSLHLPCRAFHWHWGSREATLKSRGCVDGLHDVSSALWVHKEPVHLLAHLAHQREQISWSQIPYAGRVGKAAGTNVPRSLHLAFPKRWWTWYPLIGQLLGKASVRQGMGKSAQLVSWMLTPFQGLICGQEEERLSRKEKQP